MMLLVKLSLRNLLRSKRRNLFLGIGIALGFMILIIADSFSQGLSDLLLNRIVVTFTGHIEVAGVEKAGRRKFIIRDKPEMIKLIREVTEDPSLKKLIERKLRGIKEIRGSVMLFTRAAGNGKSGTLLLLGREPTPDFLKSLNIVEGNPDLMRDPSVEDPIIISRSKADELGVKVGDNIRALFQTIYGQFQTARFTVVALTGGSDIFSKGISFARLKDLKELLGYRPWETGSLQLIFKDARNRKLIREISDRIRERLKPSYALIQARTRDGKFLNIMPIKRDSKTLEEAKKLLNLAKEPDSEGIIVSSAYESSDNSLTFTFQPKYEKYPVSFTMDIIARVSPKILPPGWALIPGKYFYKIYYDHLPAEYSIQPDWLEKSPLKKIAGKEWILLPPMSGDEDMQERFAQINRMDTSALIMDVRTMYETAGQVLKMEVALKIITLIAVGILFMIVLIGVVNTLRMSIKERTREIGTIRAIGMQKDAVRNMFLLEVTFLTIFSALTGLIMAFVTMALLSHIKFSVSGPLSLLLLNGHIHFYPTLKNIIINFLALVLISIITAYFPARDAANMSPSEALRHYE